MASGTSASASTTPGTVAGDLGLHFLLSGGGQRTAFLGLGPGHAGIGLGLVGLQPGADVLADVDVGNVDRHDLEGRLRVEPAFQHRLGDACRDSPSPASGCPTSRWP